MGSLILRFFTEFDSFAGQSRHSGQTYNDGKISPSSSLALADLTVSTVYLVENGTDNINEYD